MGMSGSPYEVAFRHGFRMALCTILLTVALEAISFRTARDLLTKHPKGRALYTKAVVLNVVNHILFGVPIYVLAESLFCTSRVSHDGTVGGLALSMLRIFVIVLLHSIGY